MHLDDFAIVDLARDYHLHVECKAKTFHGCLRSLWLGNCCPIAGTGLEELMERNAWVSPDFRLLRLVAAVVELCWQLELMKRYAGVSSLWVDEADGSRS